MSGLPTAAPANLPAVSYKNFVEICGPNLVGSGVPPPLWLRLYNKWRNGLFDAGNSFAIHAEQDDEEEAEDDEDAAAREDDTLRELLARRRDRREALVNRVNRRQLVAMANLLAWTPSRQRRQDAMARGDILDIDDADEADADAAKDAEEPDIWLIDHCVQWRVRELRERLLAMPRLRQRLGAMLLSWEDDTAVGLNVVETETTAGSGEGSGPADATSTPPSVLASLTPEERAKAEQQTDDVLEVVWKRARVYRAASESTLADEAMWYLLDEVGSAVVPSSGAGEDDPAPNVRLAPMFIPWDNCCYEVMWLTKDVEFQDVIAFDVRLGHVTSPARAITVWGLDSETRVNARRQANFAYRLMQDAYASIGHHAHDNVGIEVVVPHRFPQFLPTPRMKRVWTDLQLLRDSLHLAGYSFTDNIEDADVVWYSEYMEDIRQLLSSSSQYGCFVNQFREETVLCNKARMAHTMVSFWGDACAAWLPRTYDAWTQLGAFLGDYNNRVANGDDNSWIVKPPAMARSSDMFVSTNVDLLLRAGETGRKLLCKYVHNPCTFRGRKSDMRFVVLVRSWQPLEAYLYNVFWIRVSAEPYSLDQFDVFEKHWTVMMYDRPGAMIQVQHTEFIEEWEQQYGKGRWKECHDKISRMIFDSLCAISVIHGQNLQKGRDNGMGHNCAARAAYGFDVMLDDTFQPKLLEITFSPDCHRAVKYTPSFFDDVFSTLFEGRPRNCMELKFTD